MLIAGLIATLVNSISVIVGSLLGFFMKRGLPENIKEILFFAAGLTTLGIGMTMVMKVNNFLIVLASMAIGGAIGELLDIEGFLRRIGDTMKEGDFSTGFMMASILFLVGPMTIVGSVNAGLTGDASLIYLKSLLDGISSFILASIYGIGVTVSDLSVLVVQGTLVLMSSYLKFLTQPMYLNDLIAVGGVMILGIGLKILDIKDTRIGNFMPALAIEPLIVFIISLF